MLKTISYSYFQNLSIPNQLNCFRMLFLVFTWMKTFLIATVHFYSTHGCNSVGYLLWTLICDSGCACKFYTSLNLLAYYFPMPISICSECIWKCWVWRIRNQHKSFSCMTLKWCYQSTLWKCVFKTCWVLMLADYTCVQIRHKNVALKMFENGIFPFNLEFFTFGQSTNHFKNSEDAMLWTLLPM